MSKLNGVQRGAEVTQAFLNWVEERQAMGDVAEYLNSRSRLNKSNIATELGFARSNFATNPALADALEYAEEILCPPGSVANIAKPLREANAARERANDRSRLSQAESSRLMEKIVGLEAENRKLKHKLSKIEMREDAQRGFSLLAEALENLDD